MFYGTGNTGTKGWLDTRNIEPRIFATPIGVTQVNSSTTVTAPFNALTKMKEIEVKISGTIRVGFFTQAVGGHNILVQIRKNGTLILFEVGSPVQPPNTGTYSVDIPVSYGDLIQIWVNSTGYSAPMTVNIGQFTLSYSKIPVGTPIINLE
jgi:hypothetical protein